MAPQSADPSVFDQFGDLLKSVGDLLIPSAHAQQFVDSTAEYDLDDPYLIDQAAALGNDPIAIFEFVRDQIAYEVYQGSLRGARGTLWAGAGNSVDQASLLIALLKISGFDASYLQGSLPTADAQTLVQAMFEPAPYRVIGFVPEDQEKSDPENDPELLAEAAVHTAVEALIDGAIVHLEPAFPDAQFGERVVDAPVTNAALDDASRHRVRVRIEAESYSLFSSILASLDGDPFQRQLVLDESFSAAELSGKSLALSHFVDSSGSGGLLGSTFTHTYTPFLRIIQNDEDLEDDPIVIGQNYQEVTSSLFGALINSTVTGLFLKIEIETPDGEVESYERALIDRLGFAERSGAGQISLDDFDPKQPALSPFDTFSVVVANSKVLGPAPILLESQIMSLMAEGQAIAADLDGVDPSSFTPEQQQQFVRIGEINPVLTAVQNQALVYRYEIFSQELHEQLEVASVVKSYGHKPRVIVNTTTGKIVNEQTMQFMQMDLVANEGRVIARPGQAESAVVAFNIASSLADIAAEDRVMADVREQAQSPDLELVQRTSVIRIFEEAQAQGIEIDVLIPGLEQRLQDAQYSNEAKMRIADVLEAGKLIIVPAAPVAVDGELVTGWLEVDPQTGRVIDTFEDGTHTASIGYVLLRGAGIFAVGFFIGFATVFFATLPVIVFCAYNFSNQQSCSNNPDNVAFTKLTLNTLIDTAVGIAVAKISTLLGVSGPTGALLAAGFTAGVFAASALLIFITKVDPPLPPMLVGIPVADTDSVTTQSLEVVPEPFFTLPVNGIELPLLFRALMLNSTASEQTYTVNLPNPPNGFEVITSVPQVVVPPGETGVVGIALRPEAGELPEAGLGVPIDVELSDPSGVIAADGASLTVPELVNLELELSRSLVATEPGVASIVELRVISNGNVDAIDIPLVLSLSPSLALDGLVSPVSISSGDETRITLAVTPGVGTLNQDLRAGVTALFGQDLDGNPYEATAELIVRVRSQTVLALEEYAIAATEAGHFQVAASVTSIAELLAQLEQNPTSTVIAEQLAFEYAQLAELAAVNPGLSNFVDVILNLQGLAESGNVDALLQQSQSFFDTTAPLLNGSFALDIDLPERIELEPMEDRTVPIRLENSGNQTLTLSLSLAGVPAGASASLNRTNVSLAPGEVLDGASANPVLLSLEQDFVSDQRFTLRLETAVDEVAGFIVNSSTLVSIRSAYADVVDVRVNPAALDSGATQATVRAEIVNSANTRRDVLALLEVTDAAGVVLQSLDPVPFTLTTGFEPISIDFGIVAFAPLADGAYRMRLSLLAAADTPLAGQGASGGFLVGAPVVATVEPSPILLPPGDATTTVSINVERQFDGATGVGGIQPTDPSISRVNWASASEGGTISTGAFLLDGVNNGLSPFSTATLANPMVLDLGEIRSFDGIHLHLWDGDDRSFRYLIEYSEDGVNYADLVDRLSGGMRGVQIERFESVDARFLRFSGDSTTNANLHFINELLVIGDETATPFVTEIIEIDGLADSGPTFNSGQVRTLPAGIYEVRYLDGAISPWPSDGFNSGRTWQVTVRATVPQFNKRYQIGFLEDIISRFATPQQAEDSQQGARFTFYLPARSDVYFWVQDSNAGDNRGAQRIQLRQVSGANDSLIVRVQDAMTRSVLWEQTAVAEWDTWIRTGNRDCFGCHIQTQGSSGLAIAKQKIPSLPLDDRLTEEFIDAYQFWLAPNGRVVGTNRHDFTRTALWAWAVSNFDDVDIDTLKVPLLRALDWLENLQQGNGAWTADHTGTAAENVYRDGVPTATHTAGNIQALARAIDLIEAESEMPFTEVSIDSNQVDMLRNISDEMWLRFAPLENVTGLMLTISDTFASNSNFVINEFDAFNGDQPVLIDGVQASRNQSGFNILESINDIRNNTSDGWAVGGNTIGSPARGLWRFNAPQTVDRVRITQIFGSGHQLETFTAWYTTDPNPTLASTFIPLPLELVGLANLGERQVKYQTSLEAASAFFSQPGWDFRRNIRSAAQTIFGLTDALPYLDETQRELANNRIAEVDQWLRSVQNADGGWGNRAGELSRVFHTAQALEALLESAQSTVDPAILEGAEYLLLMQRTAGNWTSPPLDSSLAATTWTQIALPTIFENFTGLTLSLAHDMPDDPTVASLIAGSAAPPLATDSTAQLLRWDGILTGSATQAGFDFELAVPDLRPGEIRQVSDGTVVDYISVDGGGQLVLDPIVVAGAHIIDIAPPEQTLADVPVTYQVALDNPTIVDQTYTLSVQGLEDFAFDLPGSVFVAAGEQVSVPLTVSPTLGAGGNRAFTVTVETASAGTDSAQALLQIAGAVDIPLVPPDEIEISDLGVDVRILTPNLVAGQGTAAVYTVRVTNVGDVAGAFDLSGSFPTGFGVRWLEDRVTLNPGAFNYRDVGLILTPPPGTAGGAYSFTVAATAGSDSDVNDSDQGVLSVVDLGVAVELTPSTSQDNASISLNVTNTGLAADVYSLQLLGPVANFATLAVDQVALAAGETRTIEVAIGTLDVSLPGNWTLQALAISNTNSDVQDISEAQIAIANRRGVRAEFQPALISLDAPASVSSALLVENTGNVEDRYVATVQSISDPLTADLLGLDRTPTQQVFGFRLPPFSQALIPLQGEMSGFGRSSVIVEVVSLNDASVTDSAALQVNAVPPGPVGITLIETDGDTVVEESGTTDTVDVVLDRLTIGEVSLTLAIADADEASVVPATLIFDPSNWDVPQTVTITGLDDGLIDGDQISQLIVAVSEAEDDPDYGALPPAVADVTVVDVVAGELLISPRTLMVIEGNEGVGFSATLNRQPAAEVSVDLVVSDGDLIELSTIRLTFTPDDWDVAQTVIVTAVDDDIQQETLGLEVVTGVLQSADAGFDGFDPADVEVIRFDDELGGGNEGPSAALWAQGDDRRAIDWAGGAGRVDGLTHSNGGIRLRGNDKELIGGTRYVTDLDLRGGTFILDPEAEQVDEQPWPYQHQLIDYQPGGRAALAAGDQFFDLTDACASGRWRHDAGDGSLAEGLYWVPCDVSLNVSDLSGAISVVASGSMQINGSNVEGLTHFSDGVLFWSEATGRAAIKLSGSGLNLTGYQFARNGQIDISGSSMVLACGLAADSIKLNGSNHLFSGDGCSTPTANDLVVTTTQGEALTIQLSGSDLDGDVLGFSIASSPQHGLLSGSGDLYTYQPDADFIGDDAFTYQVDDGVRRSAPATVSIAVTVANSDNGIQRDETPERAGQILIGNEGLGGNGNQPLPIPALGEQQRWLLMLLLLLLGWAALNRRRGMYTVRD